MNQKTVALIALFVVLFTTVLIALVVLQQKTPAIQSQVDSTNQIAENPSQESKYAQQKIKITPPSGVSITTKPQDRQNSQWTLQDDITQEEITVVALKHGLEYAKISYPNNTFIPSSGKLSGWQSSNTNKIIYILEDRENEEFIWITSDITQSVNKAKIIGIIGTIADTLEIDNVQSNN